jgi:hypothetical protein
MPICPMPRWAGQALRTTPGGSCKHLGRPFYRISTTAAMLSLLAQIHPSEDEDRPFARLREFGPQAWPNSLMITYADDLLGREGRLLVALRRHYAYQLQYEPKFLDWMTRLGRHRELNMAA